MTKASTSAIPAATRMRGMEDERREHVRTLRAAVAEAGYEGRLRLQSKGRPGVYDMWVDPVCGIWDGMLRKTVGSADSPANIGTLTTQALRMADLAMLARRRAETVRSTGGDARSPPAWAFLGNPVIRGVIALKTIDPSRYRPLDPARWQEYELRPSVHDLRLGYTGVVLEQERGSVRIDAAAQMARIVMPGEYPDAVVGSLKDRPLGDLLGLPGLERGGEAGDTPILKAWVNDGNLRITVDCRLVPLARAPEGADTSWLQEWHDRHYR